MLFSLALIFLLGILLSGIFNKLKLPGLIGMIITGIILSPYALDLIDDGILNIAGDLRQIALVIILTRAGLALDINDLKKVGRPAILMCFVPACFEIIGCVFFAPMFLEVTRLEAALMGSVIAAVSPAVIVPRMIKLIENGYGCDKSIPQLVLAGASVDDVFVIVVFTAFSSLLLTGKTDATAFVRIPVSIFLGIALGFVLGLALIIFFKKIHMRDSVKMLILLSVSFLLIELQNKISDMNILNGMFQVSGLLAIMSFAIVIKGRYEILAKRLSSKYNKLWVGAEIMLFVLVGATVDLKYVKSAGVMAIILVLTALVFRMVGVFVCLIKTKLNKKERLFTMFAYTPKATVQAAIGAVPMSMGLACGNIVLTVAVLSILITAPLGALLVDNTYKRFLRKPLG